MSCTTLVHIVDLFWRLFQKMPNLVTTLPLSPSIALLVCTSVMGQNVSCLLLLLFSQSHLKPIKKVCRSKNKIMWERYVLAHPFFTVARWINYSKCGDIICKLSSSTQQKFISGQCHCKLKINISSTLNSL